jgi:hypothetical protein
VKNDGLFSLILFLALATFIFGLIVGYQGGKEQIVDDCEKFTAFYQGDTRFLCLKGDER